MYDRDLGRIAWRMCNGDTHLAEDLRSEMHLALLMLPAGRDKAFYLWKAKCKAIDYLRSKARNYSYGGVVKHVSLEAMEKAGFQIDTEGNVYAPESHASALEEDLGGNQV
jgi:hypothetical protein